MCDCIYETLELIVLLAVLLFYNYAPSNYNYFRNHLLRNKVFKYKVFKISILIFDQKILLKSKFDLNNTLYRIHYSAC